MLVKKENCEIKKHINEKESTGERRKKKGVRGEREKERERKRGRGWRNVEEE